MGYKIALECGVNGGSKLYYAL